jgi:hypothetical protein
MKHITLYKKLHAFAPKLHGEKTMGQVMYWVRKMLTPHNVKVNRIIDKKNLSLSGYTIGGFYDPTGEFDEKDIEVYLVFNEEDKNKTFLFEDWSAKMLIDELFITLVHEKRHRFQFKQRGNAFGPQYRSKVTDEDLKAELNYYGDPDEVDAYAQEAIIEERLGRDTVMGTQAKYRNLFANYDPKVYNRFLKKYYKFDQKISL